MSYDYYANPRRRRRRRSYRRHNPSLIPGVRRNPSYFGINVEESVGAAAGAIGTAYLDSALVGPFLGPMLTMAGNWKPAIQAVVSAVGAHWLVGRFARRYARLAAPGANLYATLGVANTAAPGLIPITIGVPKQLAGIHLFAATQPPAPAMTAPAAAGALPAGATTGGGTQSQTGGRRIQAPNGL